MLCQLTGVDGVGLSAQFTLTMSVPLAASDELVLYAEQLQFTFGQGPCWQARHQRTPVLLEDLGDPTSPTTRSAPLYAAHVSAQTPYQAAASSCAPLMAALPMCLTYYRRTATAPWDLATVADATATAVAALSAGGHQHTPGSPLTYDWLDGPATDARGQVWVAEQVIAEAVDADADTALSLLRAVAYREGLTVDALAAEVVAGRWDVSDITGQR